MGDELRADEVGNEPYDYRNMCWATTDKDQALRWALQRKVHVGPTLHVYEVDLTEPEVDTNIHRQPTPGEVPSSRMAPSGRVVCLTTEMDQTSHPNFKPMYRYEAE